MVHTVSYKSITETGSTLWKTTDDIWHNELGPAFIWQNGIVAYYLFGRCFIDKLEWEWWTKNIGKFDIPEDSWDDFIITDPKLKIEYELRFG